MLVSDDKFKLNEELASSVISDRKVQFEHGSKQFASNQTHWKFPHLVQKMEAERPVASQGGANGSENFLHHSSGNFLEHSEFSKNLIFWYLPIFHILHF